MKKLFIILFLNLSLNAFGHSYFVKSGQELKSAVQKLLPGDEVVIANGNYPDLSVELTKSGSKEKPILVRAETTGKVSISGNINKPVWLISGDYVILSGLNFVECVLSKADGKNGVLVQFNNTNASKLLDCHFIKNTAKVQFMPLVIVSGNGSWNEVSKCSFIGNVDNQDIQVKITKDLCPQQTLILNNLFRDKNRVSWKNGNGGECVQVGQDPVLLGTTKAYTIVEANRFLNCNGENEIVSNKSSNNSYIANYFESNDGELVMRGGHDCIINNNTFVGGSGGIRINGTGHQIKGNKITHIKTAIRLMYGMAKGKNEIGFYIAASNCTIIENEIKGAVVGILIGDSKNADWTGKFDINRYPSPVMQSIAPFDNEIENNKIVDTKNPIVKVD